MRCTWAGPSTASTALYWRYLLHLPYRAALEGRRRRRRRPAVGDATRKKKGTLWAHTRGGRRACTGPAQRRVATFVMHATQHREGQRWGGRGPIETGRGPLPRRSAAGAGLTQMGPPLQARPGCGGAVDKGGGGRARARFCLRRPPTSSTVVVVVVALAGPQWCGRAVPQP